MRRWERDRDGKRKKGETKAGETEAARAVGKEEPKEAAESQRELDMTPTCPPGWR